MVVRDRAKVAISAGPFGTVAGVQFAAVPQSPLLGLRFHVALPARLLRMLSSIEQIDNKPIMKDILKTPRNGSDVQIADCLFMVGTSGGSERPERYFDGYIPWNAGS